MISQYPTQLSICHSFLDNPNNLNIKNDKNNKK